MNDCVLSVVDPRFTNGTKGKQKWKKKGKEEEEEEEKKKMIN